MKKTNEIIEKVLKKGLDGLFLVNDSNIRYVSGFAGSESYILLTAQGQFFITDARYTEQAERECPGFQVIEWKKTGPSLEARIKELADKLKLRKIGLEENFVSYGLYKKLDDTLTEVDLIPTSDIVELFRYIKDEKEIDNIRKAAQFADKAFAEILSFIKPGLTEKQVAFELEYYLNKAGSDGPGFPTILVSGVNTSLPHGIPADTVLTENSFITMDFGGKHNGYPSDMTRTIILGKANQKQKQIYNLVKEAQQAALDRLEAGILGSEPDKVVREIFAREGVEDKFCHGLGHGVGLDIHEEPYMTKNCQRILKEGCIITVEPGLYFPGWGGVRIEDTVVIGEDGIEILTKSPKGLIEI